MYRSLLLLGLVLLSATSSMAECAWQTTNGKKVVQGTAADLESALSVAPTGSIVVRCQDSDGSKSHAKVVKDEAGRVKMQILVDTHVGQLRKAF